MQMKRHVKRLLAASALILAAGCAAPDASRRAGEWRQILAAEAPVGAPAAAAERALRSRGITPGRGTYRTVRDDGTETSHCPDPKAAVTGIEAGGSIGFRSTATEITVCLDPAGRVAGHHVGVWVQ